MPRPIQEILDHADDLAKRFEDYEPQAEDERDPASLKQLRDAVLARPTPSDRFATPSPPLVPTASRGRRSAPCSVLLARQRASATATPRPPDDRSLSEAAYGQRPLRTRPFAECGTPAQPPDPRNKPVTRGNVVETMV